MKKEHNFWYFGKIGLIILIILACASCLVSQVGVEIDYRKCYKEKENKMDAQVQGRLQPGMSQEEVIRNLEVIAPVHEIYPSLLVVELNGNEVQVQIVRLRICMFYRNSIDYRIIYTKDGYFLRIERWFNYD